MSQAKKCFDEDHKWQHKLIVSEEGKILDSLFECNECGKRIWNDEH